MTFTFKLERADGTPAEPPTMESTATNWPVGETIPLGRDRTLRVVADAAGSCNRTAPRARASRSSTAAAQHRSEPHHARSPLKSSCHA